MSTKEKIAALLTRPVIIMGFIGVSLTLSILYGGAGTLFGYMVVLLTLWAVKWQWSFFGFQRNPLWQTLAKSMLFMVLVLVANDILLQPLIEHYFGFTDLEALNGIKGNRLNYIIFILLMWVTAAFGEEIFYRGYMLKRMAIIMGDANKSWAFAILISASIFGLAHLYQGISGVITTAFVGVIMGAIFYKNRTNLWVGVLTHGFYNMVGITLLYLGKERVITVWVQEHLYFFLN